MKNEHRAVAPLAAIYAELGFFGRELLQGSRSFHSTLNGHPGPLLPGVHLEMLEEPSVNLTAPLVSDILRGALGPPAAPPPPTP
mgnify:CR=1 FL=1